MNGYTSMNAAITVEGHKKTLPAKAPLGVFIDLGVFAAAPVRMIRAGLGDSLCRSTAQADWLLSRHLRDTPYREAPFALLAADDVPVDHRHMASLQLGRHAVLLVDRREIMGIHDFHVEAIGAQVIGVALAAAALRVLEERRVPGLLGPRWGTGDGHRNEAQ